MNGDYALKRDPGYWYRPPIAGDFDTSETIRRGIHAWTRLHDLGSIFRIVAEPFPGPRRIAEPVIHERLLYLVPVRVEFDRITPHHRPKTDDGDHCASP